MASTRKVEIDLDQLCAELRETRDPESWATAKAGLDKLGNDPVVRMKFLNAAVFTEAPIIYDGSKDTQEFKVLQGDIVSSVLGKVNDQVYPFEETEPYLYMVLPCSCSVQPKRLRNILTARLIEIRDGDAQIKSVVNDALFFRSTKFFYIPAIEHQAEEVLGNLACLEEVSYFLNEDLQVTTRVASLSEFGWHLLNAFLTNAFTRPSKDDYLLRKGTQPSVITVEV